jgi:hypothetical protein
MLNMQGNSINNWLLSSLDYKVVNAIHNPYINIMKFHYYVWTQRSSLTHIRGCHRDSNQYTPCKGNNLTTRHTWLTKTPWVATFCDDYQRVGPGPTSPQCMYSTWYPDGHPWVAHTLFWCTSIKVAYRPTQRPSKLLSLWDPINPICIST